MYNKGYTNTTEFKAVPCNIVEEIFRARDTILACDDDTKKDYEGMFKESFEDWKSDLRSLGDCFCFLTDYQSKKCKVVDIDINIYSIDYYQSRKGKYCGLCKLPNGADIIVFDVSGEESGFSMCQVVYFDGNMLRTFTPYQGNAVNMITKTCLGDEEYMDKHIVVNDDLYKIVYPDGLDFNSYDYANKAFSKYCVFTGLVESENEADGLRDGRIELDWDLMSSEIENALC